MQLAYGTGRRRGLEEVAEDLPFWTRHAVHDDRTRPAHAALDGLTLPANHPFWNDHYPPDGFNCRCNVTAMAAPSAGYNPENPSGDYKLAYNQDGVPVAASDGMQVHNLSGGKFKGVPRQAGLREAIEAAAERARQSRRP